jgi:hypothetical protein
MLPPIRVVALALILSSLPACGSALARGESQFGKGRYPEAKQTFTQLEDDSRGWDDARRAEYALYRGLTHAALGDRAQAGVWLREAQAIEDAHPGSLSGEDGRRLAVGLEADALE